MRFFKRNQVEEALSRVFESEATEPTSELRTRIKRLLETDRSYGRSARSLDPVRANYAFFSEEAKGSGVEVWFSEYEAFALLNGLRLLNHGWPQTLAVQIMRRVRRILEPEHSRIMGQDPKALFDAAEIRRRAKPGDWAVDNTDPVFLSIVIRPGDTPENRSSPPDCSVCRGVQEAMKWAQQASGGLGGFAMFEIVNLAHWLGRCLTGTEPRRRGPGA
ncbi:MAG: hypothetical protein AB7S93_23200 [Xanthobacteraceae bacterium]